MADKKKTTEKSTSVKVSKPSSFNFRNYKSSDTTKQAKKDANAHSTYKESAAVSTARNEMDTHAANKVQDWSGGTYGAQIQDALNRINNREKFSYDLNGDALYQQYKDQYMTAGKLAMADTMGQAAALSGGYGNSYAVTAGNQAYMNNMSQLNNVIPQLYQMALDTYNREGEDMYRQLGTYQDLYNTEYGEYRDRVADWNTTMDRLQDRYYREADTDYSRFATDRDYFQNRYQDSRDYDYGVWSDSYNRAFDRYKQRVSDYQWGMNYNMQGSQFDREQAMKQDQFAQNMALEQAKLAETIRSNKADEAYNQAVLAQKKSSSGGSSSGGSSSKKSSKSSSKSTTKSSTPSASTQTSTAPAKTYSNAPAAAGTTTAKIPDFLSTGVMPGSQPWKNSLLDAAKKKK